MGNVCSGVFEGDWGDGVLCTREVFVGEEFTSSLIIEFWDSTIMG